MCGRAGRPPFNDTGTVIIMTRRETVIIDSLSLSHPFYNAFVYCFSVIQWVLFLFLSSPFYACPGSSVWESLEWMWNGGITVCIWSLNSIIDFGALDFCAYFVEDYACLLIRLSTFSCYFRLLSCVTEHLTAEIVQMTVSDITKAIEWMKCSYLYVRMKKACILWAPIGFEKGSPYTVSV